MVKDKATKILGICRATGKSSYFWIGIVAGVILGLVLSWLFSLYGGTAPAIRLISVTPEPGETVPVDAEISLKFSDYVVDEEQVGQLFSSEIIQTEPRLLGQYIWQTRDRLRFVLDKPLAPSTRYTGIVDLSLVPVSGGRLELSAQPIEFSTERFAVLKAGPSSDLRFTGSSDAPIQLEVEFNYSVDAVQLRKHVQITDVATKKPIEFSLTPDSGTSKAFTLTLHLSPALDPPSAVTLSIDSDLTCVGGSLGLAEDFQAEFALPTVETDRDLEVHWLFPMNDYPSPGSMSISIGFSDEVSPSAFTQAAKLEPEVSFSILQYGTEILLTSDRFRPGGIYTLTVAAGLISQSGFELREDFTGTVAMPNLDPRIEFDDPGIYLPRHALQSVAVNCVNVSEVEVAVYQIFRNNLAPLFGFSGPTHYRFENDLEIAGQLIETRFLKSNAVPNEETVLHIDLSHLQTSAYSGVYGVVVRDRYNRWRSDARLINCSDLGIVFKASEEDLLAMVCSIETLEPISGAVVSVLSINNQEIGTRVTGPDGIAYFENMRTTLSEFKPLLVTVESGSDFSFLPLDMTKIDLVGLDVSGRDVLKQGYEAFVYCDRDLFRPGDTMHIAGFVRGSNVSVPQSIPAQLRVYDPGGGAFREIPAMIDDTGSFEITLDIPAYAMTGEYLATLMVADKEIGRCQFLVEEFMPERVKVTVELDANAYSRASAAQVQVSAESLLGSKVSGREVELSVRLKPFEFKAPGFAAYSFTDSSREYTQPKESVTSGVLSEDGTWTHTHKFAEQITPPSACEAEFRATVREIGGRTSLGTATAIYHPYDRYAGVRVLSGQQAAIGEPIQISGVAVNPDGTPAPGSSLKIEVFKVQWSTVYSRTSDGRYEYDVKRHEDKLFEQVVTAGRDATAEVQYIPRIYGTYKVVVSDASTGEGHRASVELYVRGSASDSWPTASPEEVTIQTDAAAYKPGTTAKVRILSPFAGKALVTVERERIFRHFVIDVPQGASEIDIPVTSEYVPNVYVTVQVIRSPKGLNRYEAVRAFGTYPILVETGTDKLQVDIVAPQVIRPNKRVDVDIVVTRPDGGQLSSPCIVTLAAVDEGICQITGYDAPSPFDFFYGRKKLSVLSYDIYRLLIAEPKPATPPSSPGGDIDESRAGYAGERHYNPVSAKRVEPVSLWSGLVRTDEQGRATMSFDIPEFSGTLRLMAVAASGRAFGSSSKTAIVEDEIVISATLPRFLSTGDSFEIPVSIRNATGVSGSFSVELSSEGPVSLKETRSTVDLHEGEESLLTFSASALDAPGTAIITVTASGNGATSFSRTELPVRPATQYTTSVVTGTVGADSPVTLSSDTEFVAGTGSYTLTVGALPTAQLGAALQYLIKYPYGCLEQTVSSCFPLLYYRDLAAQTDPRLSLIDVSRFVEQGIDKIESMQLPDGSFSFWPGTFDRSIWSSVYAAHFLVEARSAGYRVSERVYKSMLSYLEALANRKATSSEEAQCRVYALYVLSLAGKPSTSNLAYMKKSGVEGLTAFSRSQLAAALALAGDLDGARQVAPDKFDAVPVKPETGGTFRSPARDDAVMLHALVTVDPDNPAVYALTKRLIDAMGTDGTWGTTQSTAFALLALGKAASVYEQRPYSGKVLAADGSTIAEFNSSRELILDSTSASLSAALASGSVTLTTEGEGTAYYALTIGGVPVSPVGIEESDRGIKVRREYLDRDGNPIDMTAIRQGDVIVVHISVAPEVENLKNVIIVDMLPAGLEIENPRLRRDVHLTWTNPQTLTPDYMDVRDDRMILFASFRETGEYHFYYAVRAITVGDFSLPPIKAECMYDPAVNSLSGSGSITVVRE